MATPPKRKANAAVATLRRNVVDAAYLTQPAHLRTRQQRADACKALRVSCPRESHAAFVPLPDRPDPIALLIESSARMLASPFAFFRGAAAIMAADLSGTVNTGLGV